MMEVIVEVCRAFALTVSAKKTETMCMPPPRTPRTMVRIEAVEQIYKQVQSFTYLGSAVAETPDMSVEIQPAYMFLLGNNLRTYLQNRTKKAER